MSSFAPAHEIQRLQNKIDIETKIKDGAENLLSIYDTKLGSSAKLDLRKQIEAELEAASAKLAALHSELQRWKEIHRATSPATSSSTEYQSNPDSWTSWDLGPNTVSRLEQSALGLDGQPLFQQPGPSRLPDAVTSAYDVLPSHLDTENGSPPSTNYVHELGPTSNGPFGGGLGIGLDGSSMGDMDSSDLHRPPPLVFDSEPAGQDSETQRENEDAQAASRSLAISLIRALRPTSPRPPIERLPSLSEAPDAADTSSTTLNTDAGDTTANTFAQHPDATQDSPLRGAVGLPRINARAAARSRAAALASGGSGHGRTPSNAAGLGNEAKQQIDGMNRLVDILRRFARVRYELPLDDFVDSIMPCLSDQAGKEIRASAYRLLRHALIHPLRPLISRCRARGLDIYLSRTLVRDNRFELEKIQAIKLVRSIMELSALRIVNAAPDRLAIDLEELLGVSVVRALAAVAEHSEDKLRHLCLQTLAELAIFDIRLLIKGGGLRSTLQALSEGPLDLAPTLVQVFIYLLDMPGTREHFRPGVDLEIAIAGLTESPAQKPITYDALLRSSARVVSVMLRSWAGLLYMCMDNKRAIKSLVQALRVNPVEVKDVLLDMLYDLFNVRGISGTIDPASKRESGLKADPADSDMPATAPIGDLGDQPRTRLNLVDHYLALLLVVFIESGLVDALVDVIEHTSAMARKATLLMGELLQVSKRVHPPALGQSIHSLPHLFSLAANFKLEKSDERQAATSALSSIDFVNRQRAHHEAVISAAALGGTVQSTSRDRSNSVEESMRRGQRQVEKTKMRIGMQIDDLQFRAMMVDTQVLITKDHTKWNLDALTDMLEGPLLNPKRLDEVNKSTKLLKRILAFFHPSALRFSSIRKMSSNRRFVRLGCLLMTTLVATQEGIRALTEDRLLRELRECLEQLDPLSGSAVSDPLMSRKRLQETLTSGYFEMLGVLTQTVEGIRVLERFRMFTPIYHLSELRNRDDVIKAIVENVDYTIDGHARIVLSKALTSNYRDVRLFATRYLADLIRMQALPSVGSTKVRLDPQNDWTISLLLTQLYDPSVEVRQMAVKVVEEACSSNQVLEKVVSMRPTLDHLGELGHPLLLKFLSTSVGIRYLWHGEYIDREMDDWFNERNQRYTVQVEVMLAQFFSIYGEQRAKPTVVSGADSPLPSSADVQSEGAVPPHFYGELTKTREGCQILRQKGHFVEFAHFIRKHGMEHSDAELTNKLKSVLWAVGNIGANALGLPFLEAEDMVSQIVEIAENSQVLTVRGTCFFVLGLISSTDQGGEILQDYGWQSVCTPLGVPMGLCVPDDVSHLVMIPAWKPHKITNLGYLDFAEPETVVINKIITSIANLGNSILAANASRTLAKLKAKHKSVFADTSVLTRAIELMDTFYYRLPVRRYIWELFDSNLDETKVRAIQDSRAQLVEAKKHQRKNGRAHSTARSLRPSIDGTATAALLDRAKPLALDPRAAGTAAKPRRSFSSAIMDDSDEDEGEDHSDFDGDEEEYDDEDGVEFSGILSSDEEGSDTSQEQDVVTGRGQPSRGLAAPKPFVGQTTATALRSSTLKEHWLTRDNTSQADNTPAPTKVIGFGPPDL